MALVPKIDISIKNKCDKIDIYEETSPYVAATNSGGWGAPNETTADVTASDLKIYDYLGTTLLATFDLTTVYSGVAGAPTPGSFLALADQTWSQADGIFRLIYSVITPSSPADGYTNAKQYKLFTCNLCNCIDNLKSKIVTECDSKKLASQKETLDQLEILLYGIKSAYSCGDFTTAIDLIASAKTICDNLCNSGCG